MDLNTSTVLFQNDICLELTVTAERRNFPFTGRTELPFTESNTKSMNKAKFDVPMAFRHNFMLSGAKE